MNWRTRDWFNRRRIFQSKRPERQVHEVTTEVRERAATEMPPVPPFEMPELGMIRMLLHRTEPQIPVEILRHRRTLLRRIMPAINCRGPHMNLLHRPDAAALYQLNDAAVIVSGVNLRPDLGDQSS